MFCVFLCGPTLLRQHRLRAHLLHSLSSPCPPPSRPTPPRRRALPGREQRTLLRVSTTPEAPAGRSLEPGQRRRISPPPRPPMEELDRGKDSGPWGSSSPYCWSGGCSDPYHHGEATAEVGLQPLYIYIKK